MLERLGDGLLHPFTRLFDIRDSFSLYGLAGALVCALLWYAVQRPRRPLRRVRIFLRAAFPRRILRHRSSILDLKLFFATSFILGTGVIGLFVSTAAAAAAVFRGLNALLGPPPAPAAPNLALSLAVTMAILLVFDLGYWLAHWLMHRYRPLWEFHKLHHSAEVMTPLTEWRQHPVELLLFPACYAITVGPLYAILSYFLGEAAQPFTLFEVNAATLILMVTVLHLRHSHLWIPARGWLGYVIQSPAHHQIHHSNDPRHWGKNLGLFLSLWDWAFGTLYVPNEREQIEFGIGHEGHEHDSVLAAYWMPIVKASRHFARRRRRAASPAGSASAAAGNG
jgi:sterol desaturase/sphingolipid hydroxylase (fatty acid hydroxylase superfamily)